MYGLPLLQVRVGRTRRARRGPRVRRVCGVPGGGRLDARRARRDARVRAPRGRVALRRAGRGVERGDAAGARPPVGGDRAGAGGRRGLLVVVEAAVVSAGRVQKGGDVHAGRGRRVERAQRRQKEGELTNKRSI